MGIYRCFIDRKELVVGDVFEIDGDEFHHLYGVLRIGMGDVFTLVNGQGILAEVEVVGVLRKSCTVRVTSVVVIERGRRRVSIGLALLKGGHLDIAIEKGTEVGVDRFIIFRADKSEKTVVSAAMLRRIDAIITAAMKQCGRVFKPEVCVVDGVESAVRAVSGQVIWTDVEAKKHLEGRLSTAQGEIAIFVGPEAGWSQSEKSFLMSVGEPVLIHENVLRAETAVIVAAYAASVRVGLA